MSTIFYLMGKSSSGKDTMYKRICAERPDLNRITMYTTRPIRAGETEGEEYHFVDEETLQKLEDAGKVIELRAYHTVHGVWKYFTVDDGQIDLKRKNYLMIGTLESYVAIVRYFGEDAVKPIYLNVEDGLRLSRALERERSQESPKYAELCRRFLADTEDFSEEKLSEAGISRIFENVDFDVCLREILGFIEESLS